MAIALRKPTELDKLVASNKIAATVLAYLSETVKPGMTLAEVDRLGEQKILELGARPSFKGLYGFPGSVCTSVNEVVIHGIPDGYVLQEGDILGIDLGTEHEGWYGDTAMTIPVGAISAQDQKLIDCAKEALYHAIDSIQSGMRFKELSWILEQFILERGFQPLRGFCGHGIGRKPHEEPEIPNYLEGSNPKQGPKIKNGMVFCLEPMICQKDGASKVLEDKWSVVSQDGLRTSHYEHTVAVIDDRAVILSQC